MPESVSVTRFPLSAELRSTARPSASVPDIDHPCAFVPGAETLSLNVTVIVFGEVARAEETVGARFCETGAEPASARPAGSTMSPAEYERVTWPMGEGNADETVSNISSDCEGAS